MKKDMTRKEYIKANHAWLAAKAKEEGVKKLGPGVYAKVIEQGDAAARTRHRAVW